MTRFRIYEEFAAVYESIVPDRDVAAVQYCFERGVELLSHILEPDNSRASHGKKGLTYRDLIIKVSSDAPYQDFHVAHIVPARAAILQISTLLCRPTQTHACGR